MPATWALLASSDDALSVAFYLVAGRFGGVTAAVHGTSSHCPRDPSVPPHVPIATACRGLIGGVI
jgi:hypothetical protein